MSNTYAGITLPNPSSVGLREALGFQPVGVYRAVGYKFGSWHDVGWWQLALGKHTIPPEPSANLQMVRGSLAWDGALAGPPAASYSVCKPNTPDL